MRTRVRIVENNTRNFELPETFAIPIWNYIVAPRLIHRAVIHVDGKAV